MKNRFGGMRRFLLPGLALLAALSSFSCNPANRSGEGRESTRIVVPEIEKLSIVSSFPDQGENGGEQAAVPKVPLDPGEKLLQTLNVNLDLDTAGEQILVVRRDSEEETPIKIVVVDYDTVRSSYSRTWEGETGATNPRTFQVDLKDLVGDHNLEIVCRGINGKGELTLDAFRKSPSPNGLGLFFTSICQIVSNGSIEIVEVERSEGYQQGQKNGASFPIVAYFQDKESKNLLDRIRNMYYWQYQQNRYVLSVVEKVPGAVVEEKQLAELFASPSTKPFEDFLTGPWVMSTQSEGGSKPAASSGGGGGSRQDILLFLPQEARLHLFSRDVQETYEWKACYRLLSNRLLIFVENESIKSIVKRIQVDIRSINTIEVSILGEEQWDRSVGIYLRLSEELQDSLLAERQAGAQPSSIKLEGLYRGEESSQIIFEPPFFTWIRKDGQSSGGFMVYTLNQTILSMKNLDENGFPREERSFILSYTESQENDKKLRRINLLPAKIGVKGAQPMAEKSLQFEQVADS